MLLPFLLEPQYLSTPFALEIAVVPLAPVAGREAIFLLNRALVCSDMFPISHGLILSLSTDMAGVDRLNLARIRATSSRVWNGFLR